MKEKCRDNLNITYRAEKHTSKGEEPSSRETQSLGHSSCCTCTVSHTTNGGQSQGQSHKLTGMSRLEVDISTFAWAVPQRREGRTGHGAPPRVEGVFGRNKPSDNPLSKTTKNGTGRG